MAKVGAQRAAELTGKSKSTIQRAMNSGKLPYELDSNGRRVINVSELEKCFGLRNSLGGGGSAPVEQEMERVAAILEADRIKMRVQMLESQIQSMQSQIEDLREQRDRWQEQATQALITSQLSQKQAEHLQQQIEEREHRARVRRQQKIDARMKEMKAGNENALAGGGVSDDPGEDNAQKFSGLWSRIKKSG